MLKPVRLGLAGGILWGAYTFVFTLLSYYTGYAREFMELVGSFYLGYSISFMGSIIGLIWGVIDGFVFLFLLGWIYNKLDIG